MQNKEYLISLKDFMSEDFKKEFSENRFLKSHFSDICQNHIDYCFSILDDKPYDALEIYKILNNFHDILGIMPDGILPLSVDIIVCISNQDILKAIELVELIQIDCFRIEALFKIARKTNKEVFLKLISKKISMYGEFEDIKKFREEFSSYVKLTIVEMLREEQ